MERNREKGGDAGKGYKKSEREGGRSRGKGRKRRGERWRGGERKSKGEGRKDYSFAFEAQTFWQIRRRDVGHVLRICHARFPEISWI